jgi:hypothetical protein
VMVAVVLHSTSGLKPRLPPKIASTA